MMILVIDGQGGGIGKTIIEKLKPVLPKEHMLVGVGTNTMASMAMMKAGADHIATGENAVCHNAGRADIILGSLGILSAHAMFGVLSPQMARAVSESNAMKILIPMKRCGLYVVGMTGEGLPAMIDEAVDVVLDALRAPGSKEQA